ncbi:MULTISPECIES: tripartite tricarboxylate transporter substrate binding protein [unclassified Polynucleobacter]|uniref:Bug family tripartite tricarboxylate transporter substrate binding protein n=1 Tax=unclassified Polynucleobacter TaxID=2640945 RepID=UPI000A594926|nr:MULTISPECIES: tripartite tricarboxylate transporter substrate-binding protein [unclassified Polynucleobacter]
MNIKINNRRRILVGGLLGLFSALTFSQSKVDRSGKTVKIIIGFPPGQATDSVTRILADKLGAFTGNSYIVDNRPGQGGSIALGALAKSPADGSVMSVIHMSAIATNPHLYQSVAYDSLKDFEPAGLIGDLPFVLVCNPNLPFKNLKDLISYAKTNPDQLTNASSGNGTVSHLAMEKLKRDAGIKITHVPYKGSVAGLTDVMSGNVAIALETASSVRTYVESGKLRALAIGSSKQIGGVFEGVPTLRELGFKDINAVTWLMIIYPAGTPKPIISSTFAALSAVMSNPEVEQSLISVGLIPRTSKSPEEAQAYLRSEYKYWGDSVKASGVRLE